MPLINFEEVEQLATIEELADLIRQSSRGRAAARRKNDQPPAEHRARPRGDCRRSRRHDYLFCEREPGYLGGRRFGRKSIPVGTPHSGGRNSPVRSFVTSGDRSGSGPSQSMQQNLRPLILTSINRIGLLHFEHVWGGGFCHGRF
jgi:hypothetical protein